MGARRRSRSRRAEPGGRRTCDAVDPHRVPPGRRASGQVNVDGSAVVADAARGVAARPSLDRPRLRRQPRPVPRGRTSPRRSTRTDDRRRRPSDASPRRIRGRRSSRTSLIYGGPEPGPQERLARDNRRFFVDEIRSPVQVGDLADALLELLELDLAGPLHLGGADDVSRFDFAVLLGADPARLEAGAHDARPGAGRLARQLACSGAPGNAPARRLRGALGLAEPSARPPRGPRASAGSARAGRGGAPPCTRRAARRRRPSAALHVEPAAARLVERARGSGARC